MKRIGILVVIATVFIWAEQTRPQTTSQKLPTNFVVLDSTGKALGPVTGVTTIGHVTVVAMQFQGK